MRNYGKIKLVEKRTPYLWWVLIGFFLMLVGLSAAFITGPDSDDENIGGAMTAIFGFVFCIGSIVCIVRPLVLTIDETGVEIRQRFTRAKRIVWHDVRETSLGHTGVTIFLKGMHSKVVQVPDLAGVDREQVHDLLDYRFKWYRENSK